MIRKLALSALFIVVTAGWALAQSPTDIDRLRAALAHKPEDQTVDTALIFTNLSNHLVSVKLQAFTAAGDAAGTAVLDVPANGLAYTFASDLRTAGTEAFLGHVEATCRNVSLMGTAVLLGGGTTDLPVHRRIVVTTPSVTARANAIPRPLPSTRVLKLIFPTVAAY